MNNKKEQFNNFLKFLKDHQLEAPAFSASDHIFIENNITPEYQFIPMEVNQLLLIIRNQSPSVYPKNMPHHKLWKIWSLKS